MNEQDIIYDYEQVLLGKQRTFKIAFQKDASFSTNQRAVTVVWKYAIEVLLKWTPEMALDLFNYDLVEKLKLDKAAEYIGITFSRKKTFSVAKILQYVYPQIVYDPGQEAIEYFQRINKLEGFEVIDSNKVLRFPKSYFDGEDGLAKASAVVNYAISVYMNDKNVYELYAFFSKAGAAERWMRSKGLSMILQQYAKRPITCLHNALPEEKKNNIFFLNEYLKRQPVFSELRLAVKRAKKNQVDTYYNEIEVNRIEAEKNFNNGGSDDC